MRKILPLLIAATVLSIAASSAYLTPLYPVYAQTNETATPSVKRILRPNVASRTANLKETAKERLEDKKEKLEDRKEKLENRLENVKERFATRSAALKEKLQKFKDKTKATRVEKINTNLNAINTRHATQMTNSLTKISQVLARLKTWVAEKEAAGTDVTDLKKVITDTEAAWATADAAVKDQADNDYTIEVNTESTVKTDAQDARNALRTDLKATHDKLVNVRQILSTALSSWKGEDK